ncbi:hypothetical protein TIFTF001_027029 [Ficus carica]|uniref:Uncharacterized protein n=1 Tax=Ficus carica TaxID=3494 RepID=A0AA88DNC7_FICCA|nr:hypothetical protein TIFTF001_027029 [Ficus carica]
MAPSICLCDRPSKLMTAWIDANPGRSRGWHETLCCGARVDGCWAACCRAWVDAAVIVLAAGVAVGIGCLWQVLCRGSSLVVHVGS